MAKQSGEQRLDLNEQSRLSTVVVFILTGRERHGYSRNDDMIKVKRQHSWLICGAMR